jgi:peroxiredoxin
LADFQALHAELQAEGIFVAAASVDPADAAQETVQDLGLEYPVAYGLEPEAVSALTGAFFHGESRFLHATGFLTRPEQTVEVACYSSGAVGRLVANNVLKLVRFYKSKG